MTNQTDKGIIEALDRILAQLLQKAAFKDSLRILFNNIDAPSSRRLIRTILWQDTDFAMALMAAAPSLGNALLHLVDELLDQINDKFPAGMLTGYLEAILQEVDRDTLERAQNKARTMMDSLYPVIEKNLLVDRKGPDSTDTTPSEPQTAAFTEATPPMGDTFSWENTEAFPEATGVLAEIFNTPFLKDIFREMLNGIKAEDGSRLARTMLWEDMDTGFSVLGALPKIINFYITAVNEIGLQLADKIPPHMFISFMADIFADIDWEAAKKGLETYQQLGRSFLEAGAFDLTDSFSELLTRPAFSQTLAAGCNQSLAAINRLEENHPGILRDILSAVVAATDKTEVNRAVRHVTEAVLDQRPPFFTLAWRTIKLYVRRWFRRKPG